MMIFLLKLNILNKNYLQIPNTHASKKYSKKFLFKSVFLEFFAIIESRKHTCIVVAGSDINKLKSCECRWLR